MKDFAMCLLGMATKFQHYPVEWVKSLRLSTNVVSGSMLAHNREMLVKGAIKKGADYMLWLDTDMRFPRDTLAHLLRWRKPFVAAMGVTKEIPASPVALVSAEGRLELQPEDRGLREVLHCGLAVALIETKYVKRMSIPRFEMPWEPTADAPMGEDVYFCRKWHKEVKEPIYVDTGLSTQIGHMGTYAYGIKDTELNHGHE